VNLSVLVMTHQPPVYIVQMLPTSSLFNKTTICNHFASCFCDSYEPGSCVICAPLLNISTSVIVLLRLISYYRLYRTCGLLYSYDPSNLFLL